MDEIVKAALAKWPNVPHCYGWLALDARGSWRMRDENAQQHHLAGDKILHTALLAFINRNYLHDAHGRWYFQNGPQRVYVNLAATPFIARTDPSANLILQSGEALQQIDAAWLTENGQLVVQDGERIALVDDRDMAQLLDRFCIDGAAARDDAMMAWLEHPDGDAALTITYRSETIPVGRIATTAMPKQFGYVQEPQADGAREFK